MLNIKAELANLSDSILTLNSHVGWNICANYARTLDAQNLHTFFAVLDLERALLLTDDTSGAAQSWANEARRIRQNSEELERRIFANQSAIERGEFAPCKCCHG